MEMVLQHSDGGMGHIALLRRQMCVRVEIEMTAEFFNDDGAIGNLFAIQLHKRQLTLGRFELHLVVHVLLKNSNISVNHSNSVHGAQEKRHFLQM